jgi:hypothetical protein
MKGLKSGVFVVLALAVMLASASPAYATVQFTNSQANASPWWTPIGDTVQSSVTGKAPSISFVIPGVGAVTCWSTFSGYVPSTHTQMNITFIDFYNCTWPGGTVSAVMTPVNSLTPWVAHLTTFLFPPSATGTINIPPVSPLSIYLTSAGQQFNVTIPAQSIRFTWTNNTTSLVINDPTVSFNGTPPAPPAGTKLQITGMYTVKTDTLTDTIDVTLMSP